MSDLNEVCGIDIEPSAMPRLAVLDDAIIDILAVQTNALREEYRLWRALGFVELSQQQFTEWRMKELQKLKAIYEPDSNLVWLREGETSLTLRLVLAHELAHAWRFLKGIVDKEALWDEWSSPEAAIAFRAGEEGIAIACARAYFAQLSDDEQWAWHDSRYESRLEEVDTYDYTEPFFARSHGWVNVLGPEFVESHPLSLRALMELPVLVESTAELLGHSSTRPQAHMDLGPLILREALVWSGVAWQNAEAIALSVVEDELLWQDLPENSECLRVAIRYSEPELPTGRYLTAREALERWSRFLGAETLESRDGYFVMNSCIPEA